MAQSKPFKRKRYLIQKNFQFSYIGKILALELLAVGATALLMSYMFLYVFNDAAMVSSGPWGKGIFWSTIVLGIVLMLILGYLGVLVSHRIAGPMFRFEKTFREVQDGNLKVRVYLRGKDEMKPLAQAFNSMLDTLVERIQPASVEPNQINSPKNQIQSILVAVANSDLPANEKDQYRKTLEGLKAKL